WSGSPRSRPGCPVPSRSPPCFVTIPPPMACGREGKDPNGSPVRAAAISTRLRGSSHHLEPDHLVHQGEHAVQLLDGRGIRLALHDQVEALRLLVDLVGHAALAPPIDLCDLASLLSQ